MKKFTQIISVLMSLFLICLAFAGCGEKDTSSADQAKAYKIGVIQYMSHPSLDNCYQGVESAIKATFKNATIDLKVGASNSADSDCVNFAKNMVAANYDMIVAIATNAAKSAFAATADTKIPVIFCAVSDPVSAGLVESNEKPGDLCTGTSDVLDLEAQVNLITTMQPDVKKIGVLYTSSEDNSLTNLKNFKEVCKKKNIEVVPGAVQSATDVPTAAESLAAQVDCINNFTDNNVVNNLQTVLSAADKHNIPVYGSEIEQVKKGCLAAVSIDYLALGKTTGQMAVDVLNGADAKTMAVKTISDATPVVNTDVLSTLKITLPDSFSGAEKVVTE